MILSVPNSVFIPFIAMGIGTVGRSGNWSRDMTSCSLEDQRMASHTPSERGSEVHINASTLASQPQTVKRQQTLETLFFVVVWIVTLSGDFWLVTDVATNLMRPFLEFWLLKYTGRMHLYLTFNGPFQSINFLFMYVFLHHSCIAECSC